MKNAKKKNRRARASNFNGKGIVAMNVATNGEDEESKGLQALAEAFFGFSRRCRFGLQRSQRRSRYSRLDFSCQPDGQYGLFVRELRFGFEFGHGLEFGYGLEFGLEHFGLVGGVCGVQIYSERIEREGQFQRDEAEESYSEGSQ
uniref:Uncharacterized protein n=1 Tax=Fagus sylvatica TaxID=28930 RepID=A0A2N9HKK4_FAGSY